MKKFLVFLICFLFLPLLGEVSLNEFGHITSSKQEIDIEYYYENDEYFAFIDNLKLIGTTVQKVVNGYLTIVTEHENHPSWLRIYDRQGVEKYKKSYSKIINLMLARNKKKVAFYNGEKLVTLDTEDLEETEFSKSIIFTMDEQGEPIYSTRQNVLCYNSKKFNIPERIRSILFIKNPIIITRHSIYKINTNLHKINTFTDEIFDAEVIDDELYLAVTNGSAYRLINYSGSQNYHIIDQIELEKKSNKIHEPIYAPLNYGEDNFPFPIGNSYAEIQQYGNTPYLHPGVDYLGDDNQEVYAVHDGFVKAVLTTGGNAYWRIAIANENVPSEVEGYLYAHLNENSITVNVGDQVNAGDLLGTLYPWNYYDFTHIHFSRVFCTGEQWLGDWWTTENNLLDVMNIQDTIPPIFEDALEDQKFAFVDENGNYLDPMNLYGEFDIVAKCHDIANSSWRIDLHDLNYSIHSITNPDSTIFQKYAFVYDFDLDTYHSGNVDEMILNTIYSRDETCYSIGNYNEREYYHIITNSDGDSLITEDDADEVFDSSQFQDDLYKLKVIARDANLNTSVDSMMIFFNNGVNTNDLITVNDYQLKNFPNPFNPSAARVGRSLSTTISFTAPTGNVNNAVVEIYNLKGQRIKRLPLKKIKENQFSNKWNGTNKNNHVVSSGIYFYKLKVDKQNIATKKMVLIK